jgi:phosphoribosyl-AMP cyclohydrolase
MKAIRTRYLPATSTKGSRIVASDCDGNRVIIKMVQGSLGACHVFVFGEEV